MSGGGIVTDRDYLGAIAAFIGARLQHPVPRCNSTNPRVSTIAVHQHKSKFGQVRVYCDLADTEQVRQAWAESSEWTDADEVPIDFRDRCLVNDADHYRMTYLEMASLVPQYKNQIFSGSDFPELLFDKDELDKWLTELDELSTQRYISKWAVGVPASLRTRQ